MPTIITRGAASATGYGFGAGSYYPYFAAQSFSLGSQGPNVGYPGYCGWQYATIYFSTDQGIYLRLTNWYDDSVLSGNFSSYGYYMVNPNEIFNSNCVPYNGVYPGTVAYATHARDTSQFRAYTQWDGVTFTLNIQWQKNSNGWGAAGGYPSGPSSPFYPTYTWKPSSQFSYGTNPYYGASGPNSY